MFSQSRVKFLVSNQLRSSKNWIAHYVCVCTWVFFPFYFFSPVAIIYIYKHVLLNLKKYLAIRASCNFQFNLHYFNKYTLCVSYIGGTGVVSEDLGIINAICMKVLACTHIRSCCWLIISKFNVSGCVYFNLTLPRVFVAPGWKYMCIDERIWLAFPIFLLKINSLYHLRNHTISFGGWSVLSVPIQFTHFTHRLIYMCLLYLQHIKIYHRSKELSGKGVRTFFLSTSVSGKLL